MASSVLPYLAGAIDSDGSIGIKKSTYHMRVRGDAHNAVYSERIALKQVTPQIPELLRDTFGGNLQFERKQGNSKDIYSWMVTDLRAAAALRSLLPYLRVKRRQAEVALELRESKDSRYWKQSYWFEKEHPEWRNGELLANSEVAALLNLTHPSSVAQALHNGTLLALPYRMDGRWRGEQPRFPRLLVEQLAANRGSLGTKNRRPPELIAWRERLWHEAHELNKIGVNGTSTYFLTGHHTPA